MNIPTLDELCRLPNDGKEILFPVTTYFISGEELEKVRNTPMKIGEQQEYTKNLGKYKQLRRNSIYQKTLGSLK